MIDRAHPSSKSLEERCSMTSTWYNFNTRSEDIHVLAVLDEGSYSGGIMGYNHPISWCKLHQQGKSFYSGGGSTTSCWQNSNFVSHVINGISWTIGAIDGDCTASLDGYFEKHTIDRYSLSSINVKVT